MKKILSLVLLFLVCVSVDAQKLSRIHAEGNKFVNAEGQTVVFQGVCMSDPVKLINDGHWNKEYFRQAKEYGANIVRFAVHPQNINRHGWIETFLAMDKGIEWAKEYGMYVIMDWHSIGNLKDEKFTNRMYDTTLEETLRFWRLVAQRYKNEPAVALYEIFNEPTVSGKDLGKCTWTEWRDMQEEIIDAIREKNPDALCICAGHNWAYDLTGVAKEPIRRSNIGYVSHPYPMKRNQPWEEQWEKDFGYVADSYPVICTEIGYCLENEKGAHVPVMSTDVYGDHITSYLEKKGISFTVWCFDPHWAPTILTDWNYNLSTQGRYFKKYLNRNKPEKLKLNELTLKDAFANDFLVGVAVSHSFIEKNDTRCLDLIKEQFSAVSPEDVLKPETVHPAPGVWNFEKGDEYCKFANENGLKALGHTLMWHNQTPNFFWLNKNGSVRSLKEMRATLKEYIEKTVTHFKGKVYAWDVVNEIISEEGGYRSDKGWEKYYGGNGGDLDELVCLAFETAHKCDPDAELYYNDYNMWRQSKVDGVVRMVKMLQSRGIRIDGVGIQAHWGLNYPSVKDIETTIDRLHELGVKVMITEFDVDMLPFSKEGQMTGQAMYDPALQRAEFMQYLNPYAKELPEEVDQEVADRYEQIMRTIWNKRDKISRVTFWGLHDGVSWKNNYPIPNRKNYPLIFDRNLQKKKAFHQIVSIPLAD